MTLISVGFVCKSGNCVKRTKRHKQYIKHSATLRCTFQCCCRAFRAAGFCRSFQCISNQARQFIPPFRHSFASAETNFKWNAELAGAARVNPADCELSPDEYWCKFRGWERKTLEIVLINLFPQITEVCHINFYLDEPLGRKANGSPLCKINPHFQGKNSISQYSFSCFVDKNNFLPQLRQLSMREELQSRVVVSQMSERRKTFWNAVKKLLAADLGNNPVASLLKLWPDVHWIFISDKFIEVFHLIWCFSAEQSNLDLFYTFQDLQALYLSTIYILCVVRWQFITLRSVCTGIPKPDKMQLQKTYLQQNLEGLLKVGWAALLTWFLHLAGLHSLRALFR